MKLILLCSFVLFTSFIVISAEKDKSLTLKKVDTEIELDGAIDLTWSQADSAEQFFQLQPYFGEAPSKRTVAKVLTTSDALYCLIVCYDDIKNIQQNNGMHDSFSGDVVSLMIDTFGDKQTAYKFAVSASGARADCRLLDDARNRDYNWDGIWFSAAKVYGWGYVVEMKIPYKSIQYEENLTAWGIDFDRWIPAENEDLYWCAYEQNEGQRISKFGTLIFQNYNPTIKGLNLEVYPVGYSKAVYSEEGKYDITANAGLDIMYNPSQKIKFLLSANPDFAQIEADPYDFNISRYESYFSERRPFFTEGSEIFNASGKQSNTGFYTPLELFYSRRIGRKLPDGQEVPLIAGTKAVGRIGNWEYGGFLAFAGEKEYEYNGAKLIEQKAVFGSGRIKKKIFENSSIGVLFVGKQTKDNTYGVIDIDGALRQSDWQLSYQFARSIKNSEGDYAGSAGFTMFGEKWLNLARGRFAGENFDISQVGYVPWRGTANVTALTGPVWYFDDGYIRNILFYFGGTFNYEKVDNFTDKAAIIGFNMQLRDNWGYELNISSGRSKDSDKKFTSYEISLSSWYNISPKWSGNLYGGYSKTYNFSRDYLAFYSWLGSYFSWKPSNIFEVGTSYNMYLEGKPDGGIEDVTYNARPYFSLTPFNDFNVRMYADNVFLQSSQHLERVIVGFLLSYNFLPKSWIYIAMNDFQDRSEQYNSANLPMPNRMHVVDRAGVVKIKYLYYF